MRFDPSASADFYVHIGILKGTPKVTRSKYYSLQSPMKYEGETLSIPSSVFVQFYSKVLHDLCDHVREIITKKECKGLKHIFLVGGFSESELLQNQLKTVIRNYNQTIRIILPPRPQSAVLTGGVQYGLNPDIITKRISQQTIGVRHCDSWSNEIHAGKQMLVTKDGRVHCSEMFKTFFTASEPIQRTETMQTFLPLYENQECIVIEVYTSSNKTVKFTSEVGVKKIGTLEMNLPDVDLPSSSRQVDVAMKFNGIVSSTFLSLCLLSSLTHL